MWVRLAAWSHTFPKYTFNGVVTWRAYCNDHLPHCPRVYYWCLPALSWENGKNKKNLSKKGVAFLIWNMSWGCMLHYYHICFVYFDLFSEMRKHDLFVLQEATKTRRWTSWLLRSCFVYKWDDVKSGRLVATSSDRNDSSQLCTRRKEQKLNTGRDMWTRCNLPQLV